ncbi:MAG: tRNA epoxyqueuosine(34) reductase QueG, partial [Pseudomonadota bacterium]
MTGEIPAPRTGDLRAALEHHANAAGFDAIAVTAAETFSTMHAERYRAFIAAGHHGDMAWMAETADRRVSPTALWPEARTVIMLAMNYGPDEDPRAILAERHRAALSCYARGKDYHAVMKKALKRVAGWLHRETGAEVKVFVDTAPVLEKPLAHQAGLGWQGKHTNLVSREYGSWLFLGSIFTTLEFPPDKPEVDHCGSCRACLDACPTNAFPQPYELDARRCISYLTIEHKGHIAQEYRAAIGNRVYGCDDCLAACPWNKFARTASEQRFAARAETDNPPLAELLAMDDAAFRARFQGTPIKRTGRDRFLRNTLIAAGNSGDSSLVPVVTKLLDDSSPLVRAMAVWALSRLADRHVFAAHRTERRDREADPLARQQAHHGHVVNAGDDVGGD